MAQSIYAFQTAEPVRVYRLDAKARAGTNWSRAMVSWYYSNWVQTLESRFNELTSLPVGWNGPHSVPVTWSCASFAANLLERICVDDLPPPSLVPGDDGTLQMEWHRNNYDVEIDVLGPSNVVATRYDLVSETEEVLHLDNDYSKIAEWANDLIKPRGDIEAAAG